MALGLTCSSKAICFVLFPSATSDYFGTKHFGMNYGWIFTAYGVAGILGPVVGGVLFDVTRQYMMAFVFAGILCFVAAGCSVFVWGLARGRQETLRRGHRLDPGPIARSVPAGSRD